MRRSGESVACHRAADAESDAITQTVLEVIFLRGIHIVVSILCVLETRNGTEEIAAVIEDKQFRVMVAGECVLSR